MITASDYGLKVGDKIRYLSGEVGSFRRKHDIFNIGDVLVLVYDDYTSSPYFHLIGETKTHPFCLGRKWERVEDVKLERTKEYSVMLTGEELVLCAGIVGNTLGDVPNNALYKVYRKMTALPELSDGVFEDCPIPECRIDSFFVGRWLDSIFEAPETEDQRKLRELKEQYESLGKAIEAMEKK